MKLHTAQVEQVRAQTGLSPVPESDASQVRLEQHFGEHTFYVDPRGLYIWEAIHKTSRSPAQVMALKIASWANDDMTLLKTHDPEATGALVVLATVH